MKQKSINYQTKKIYHQSKYKYYQKKFLCNIMNTPMHKFVEFFLKSLKVSRPFAIPPFPLSLFTNMIWCYKMSLLSNIAHAKYSQY